MRVFEFKTLDQDEPISIILDNISMFKIGRNPKFFIFKNGSQEHSICFRTDRGCKEAYEAVIDTLKYFPTQEYILIEEHQY